MSENSPDIINNSTTAIQRQFSETSEEILRTPESPADLFVTGSALIAFLIAASYLIKFFRKPDK